MVIKLYKAWRNSKKDTVGGEMNIVAYEGIRQDDGSTEPRHSSFGARRDSRGQGSFGKRLRGRLTLDSLANSFRTVLDFNGGEPVSMGRSIETDIYTPDSKISRFHARFEVNTRGISITDLNSSNGTYVNGQNIGQTPCELYDHDRIQMGDSIFEVRY